MAAVAVLAVTVAALLKLSSVGLRLARGAEDSTALMAAADEGLRTAVAGGLQEKRVFNDGNIEYMVETVPYRKEEGRQHQVMKITVTARNTATGAEFTLATLRAQ